MFWFFSMNAPPSVYLLPNFLSIHLSIYLSLFIDFAICSSINCTYISLWSLCLLISFFFFSLSLYLIQISLVYVSSYQSISLSMSLSIYPYINYQSSYICQLLWLSTNWLLFVSIFNPTFYPFYVAS
jgi:hypothetical protein